MFKPVLEHRGNKIWPLAQNQAWCWNRSHCSWRMLFSSVWRPVCESMLLLSDDEPLKNRELGVLTKWMVTKVRNFQAWLKGCNLDFSERTWPLIFLGNRTESLREKKKKHFITFHHKTKFNFTLAIHFLFGQASMCWLAY